MAVLGNVREAHVAALAYGAGDEVAPAHVDGALRIAQPREGFDQLGLSVAFDTRDAENLSRCDAEAHVVHDCGAAGAGDGEVPHTEQR